MSKVSRGYEMIGRIISDSRKWCAAKLAKALFQILHGLNQKIIYKQPATIEDHLYKIARVTGKSEYDVFCRSAESWLITHERVEQDFKAYLLHQSIPYYVTDFVRKNKKHIDELHIPLF
jgi:hypothetical protein